MKDKSELPVLKGEQDAFALFDQLDDRLILAELENRVTDVWVYHFVIKTKKGERHVWGISKEGTDECVKEMSKKGMALRDADVDYRVDPTNPEYVLFTAKVDRVLCDTEGREIRVDSSIGTKRQRIMMVDFDSGSLIENPFWFEQGSQKAIRNARLRNIPAEIKTKIIAYAKEHKKIQKFETTNGEKGQSPTEKKKSEKQEQKEPGFPPDSEKTKKESPEDLLTQEQKMKIVRLETILIDKYGYKSDGLIKELEKRFGTSNINGLTGIQANNVIYFLECTIDWAQKVKEGKV